MVYGFGSGERSGGVRITPSRLSLARRAGVGDSQAEPSAQPRGDHASVTDVRLGVGGRICLRLTPAPYREHSWVVTRLVESLRLLRDLISDRPALGRGSEGEGGDWCEGGGGMSARSDLGG